MPGMAVGFSSASDDAARAEPRDVGARVAEAREHGVGVLAERRRRRADRRRRVGELDRIAERAPPPVQLDHHAAVAHLRIGERLAEGGRRAEADIEVGQLRDPRGHRLLTEPGADAPEHLLALRALDELLLDELRHTEALTEGAPEVRLEGAHRHVAAVLGLVDGVARVAAGEHGVAAHRLLPLGEVAHDVHHLPGERAVEHRDVDELPPARLLARRERRQDAHRRHERAAADVGDLHARDDGRPARGAREPDDAREAEVVDVVPDPVAIGPVLAVAGDRAIDEARIQRAQRLVVDPEARRRPGARALEHHVRLARQALEDGAPLGRLQVERQAPLVPPEERDAHAHRIGRGVDGEHVHPQVREQHGAERPRQLPRQIQHPEPRERTGHIRVEYYDRATRDNLPPGENGIGERGSAAPRPRGPGGAAAATFDEAGRRSARACPRVGRGAGAPAAPPGSPRPPPPQCPAFTSAATVNQSSVIPAFSPWLKYQPCSPGKRWLGSEALVACSSCASTMTIAGAKMRSSGYSTASGASRIFWRIITSLIQIFHSSPPRSYMSEYGMPHASLSMKRTRLPKAYCESLETPSITWTRRFSHTSSKAQSTRSFHWTGKWRPCATASMSRSPR